MGLIVVVILAVLIFIGLKNKKKIAAEQQKAAAEKAASNFDTQNKGATPSPTPTQNNASATNTISAQSNSFAPFKNEAEKQYYEMAYGLLSSSSNERSLDDLRRFVEFHTSRKGDFSVSCAARKFLKEGIGYSPSLFKSNEDLTKTLTSKGVSVDQVEQIIKLNKSLDESWAYRYFPEDADKLCDSNNYKYDGFGSSETVVCKISKGSVKSFVELFSDETVKQYFVIVSALLESIKSYDVNFDTAQNYIKFYTKQSCDSQKLKYVFALAKINGAKNKFAITSDDINKYKCSMREAYNICDPEKYNETVRQYCTIVCALLESIKCGSIGFDAAKKYIEFHTKQSCDNQKLKCALDLTKISGVKDKFAITSDDINKHKCSMREAYSICDPERHNETVRQYCTIVSALLESVKCDSINSDAAKLYIEFYTKQPCDSQKLKYALVFIKEKDANDRFAITSDDVNKYKCSMREAYSICDPEKYNETVRQYYAIVSALLESIKCDSIDSDGAKKYVEFYTKPPCDTQKLEYALAFTKEKDAKDKFAIISDDVNKYKCSMREAYSICYHEIIESIKTDCKEIFNVVASYGAKHFEEGLFKKISLYEEKIGTELTQNFFRQTVQDMYFEGDETTKDTLFNRMNQYSYDTRMRTYYYSGNVHMLPKQVAAIVLRALHFEKYGRCKTDYKAITENNCREFIANCEYFKAEIEEAVANDPFNVNKNELLNDKAKEIFNVFESIKTNNSWYLPCDSESCYADSLCNGFLKWIAKSYKKEFSTDINKAFDILFEHFKPTDKDFQIIREWKQEAERQRQEEQARQEREAREAAIREERYERERAIRRQEEQAREAKYERERAAEDRCRACVNYYKCSYDVQKNSLSCSAFCPK